MLMSQFTKQLQELVKESQEEPCKPAKRDKTYCHYCDCMQEEGQDT